MTPTELLAELHRREIAVHVTDDGHLRLTGPAEAALTPALRAEVEAQHQALVTLLAPPQGGSGDARTVARPSLRDPAVSAPPADGTSAVPGWLPWVGLAVVAAILGAAYLLGRPDAPAPPAPSPASAYAGWPYGGQSWNW
jgi:hypothetical protein